MPDKDPGSSDPRERDGDYEGRSRRHGWLTSAAVLLLIVSLGAVGVLWGVRWYLLRDIPAGDRAEIRRFMTEPVHFPAEWAQVEPPSQEVLDGMAAVGREGDRFYQLEHGNLWQWLLYSEDLDRLRHGLTISQESWTSLSQVVAGSRALVEESSRTASLEGYEGTVVVPGGNSELFIDGAESASDSACAFAFLLASEGKYKEALDSAMLPLRLAPRRPDLGTLTHLICHNAVETIAAIALECSDRRALRNALQELVSMRNQFDLNYVLRADVEDNLGPLRLYKRYGYPVDLAPGRSRAFYYYQHREAASRFPYWVLDRLPSGDPERRTFLAMMGDERPTPTGRLISQLVFKLEHLVCPEKTYRYDSHRSYWQNAEYLQQARFDLLLLLLSKRMMTLEGRTPRPRPTDYVPEFLPEEPLDPFSGNSYILDAASGRHYSVGPDRKDDGLRVISHSENGPDSRGDVTMP